jgi:Pyridine nucleotide-disulphide oxidoreductase
MTTTQVRSDAAALGSGADTPPDTRAHRVAVVGAGFGGLQAALGLRHAPVETTVVDRRNFHSERSVHRVPSKEKPSIGSPSSQSESLNRAPRCDASTPYRVNANGSPDQTRHCGVARQASWFLSAGMGSCGERHARGVKVAQRDGGP